MSFRILAQVECLSSCYSEISTLLETFKILFFSLFLFLIVEIATILLWNFSYLLRKIKIIFFKNKRN